MRLSEEGDGEEEQVLAAVEDQAFLICLVYSLNKVRKPILVKLLNPMLRQTLVGVIKGRLISKISIIQRL